MHSKAKKVLLWLINADVAELADAHGSGPCAARLVGSTPTVGTICFYRLKKICGYGITAVHQPSKLVIGVRPPLPAPCGGIPEWPKGADCKSASTSFDGSNPSSTTIFYNTAPRMRCFFLFPSGTSIICLCFLKIGNLLYLSIRF